MRAPRVQESDVLRGVWPLAGVWTGRIGTGKLGNLLFLPPLLVRLMHSQHHVLLLLSRYFRSSDLFGRLVVVFVRLYAAVL